MKNLVLAFLLVSVLGLPVVLSGCASKPIHKGCSQVGKLADGTPLFEGCEKVQ